MNQTPPVSAMCLTYGRPRVLEEAIESFLRQDYPGTKELIVLNDLSEQELVFDHPDVVMINVPRRFHSVGEKRNAAAALASHDILFVWDDDDVYLPHRISYSIRQLDPSKGFFKPSKAWVLNNGVIGGPKANLFHSGSCWTRNLFDRAHGYRHMGSGQDLDLELAFEKLLGPGKNFNQIKLEDIYYIYRWQGTESYHLSAFGQDREGAAPGQEKVLSHVRKQLADGTQPTGRVSLVPRWRTDYVELVRNYLKTLES